MRSKARQEVRAARGQERRAAASRSGAGGDRQGSQGPRDSAGTGPDRQVYLADTEREGVSLRSVSRPPLARRRGLQAKRQAAPQQSRLRLRSVGPRRQKANLQQLRLGEAVREARENREHFKSLRFREREAFRRQWTAKLPRGTVGNAFNELLPPNCSSCDERKRVNRPLLERFTARRIQQLRDRAEIAEAKSAAKPKKRSRCLENVATESAALRIKSVLAKKKAKKKVPVEESSETESPEGGSDFDPGSEPDYGDRDPTGGGGAAPAVVHAS